MVIHFSRDTRTAGIKLLPALVWEGSVEKLPSLTTSQEKPKLGSLSEKRCKLFSRSVNGLIHGNFCAALHIRNLLIGHTLKVIEPDAAFLRFGKGVNGSM